MKSLRFVVFALVFPLVAWAADPSPQPSSPLKQAQELECQAAQQAIVSMGTSLRALELRLQDAQRQIAALTKELTAAKTPKPTPPKK
jgi:D-alanyl-D-alanine carboxypeptidase